MIYLGYSDDAKILEIEKYRLEHAIGKTIIISADQFPLRMEGVDHVKYSDVIMYVTFYRLLQEIDRNTLVVINECLRTQNRYDLTYNCIRNFLNQSNHQLIFQLLPQIDTRDDFMILFDFDVKSRWKRRKFDINLVLDNSTVRVEPVEIKFDAVNVPTSADMKGKYDDEKKHRFATIGLRDPHTIPRNLHLVSGADKLRYIRDRSCIDLPLFSRLDTDNRMYVARNKRLRHDNIVTYSNVESGVRYIIIDLPHRFLDFCDFIKRTGQSNHDVLVTQLPVDQWYFNRYLEWSNKIRDSYASLRQR